MRRSSPRTRRRTGLPAGAHESRVYAGPFPPSGTHDYEFTLYAVGAAADVPAKAPLDQILHAIDPHVLARAKLVAAFTNQVPIRKPASRRARTGG